VLTTPLLLSWDGEKMSSSVGNNVPLTAAPDEMFGRTMRIPDSQLEEWWALVAEQPVPADEPMQAKLALARWIVARSHGEEEARAADEHFDRVVRQHEQPDDIETVRWTTDSDLVYLPAVLKRRFEQTTSHWRRVIDQGGVTIDGRVVTGYEVPWTELDGAVLQAGKRRFVRLNRAT
jgi:tyrosyl-tRNA synthetase